MSTVRELHAMIEASPQLSREVTRATEVFDKVLMRFQNIPESDREPILITDIRDAVIESANAAKHMTQLLDKTNEILESKNFESLISEANLTADAWIDKLFWRGLLLVLVFLLGLFLIGRVPVRA